MEGNTRVQVTVSEEELREMLAAWREYRKAVKGGWYWSAEVGRGESVAELARLGLVAARERLAALPAEQPKAKRGARA